MEIVTYPIGLSSRIVVVATATCPLFKGHMHYAWISHKRSEVLLHCCMELVLIIVHWLVLPWLTTILVFIVTCKESNTPSELLLRGFYICSCVCVWLYLCLVVFVFGCICVWLSLYLCLVVFVFVFGCALAITWQWPIRSGPSSSSSSLLLRWTPAVMHQLL